MKCGLVLTKQAWGRKTEHRNAANAIVTAVCGAGVGTRVIGGNTV